MRRRRRHRRIVDAGDRDGNGLAGLRARSIGHRDLESVLRGLAGGQCLDAGKARIEDIVPGAILREVELPVDALHDRVGLGR